MIIHVLGDVPPQHTRTRATCWYVAPMNADMRMRIHWHVQAAAAWANILKIRAGYQSW
jgi:hypothetical protein